jgi:hypothetical protein
MSAENVQKERPRNLAELAASVGPPFNDESVLHTFSLLASELSYNLHEYDVVIGDDASARLPAMVYWRMINRARQGEGLSRAEMRFANGRSREDFPSGFLPKAKPGSRALILTEYIFSGRSAMNLYEAAANHRSGNVIDIAALSISETYKKRRHQRLHMSPHAKLYQTGAGDNFVARIHSHSHPEVKRALGVEKEERELFSHRSTISNMTEIRRARTDVGKVANYLYEDTILHI